MNRLLIACLKLGVIDHQVSFATLEWLQKFGLLDDEVKLSRGELFWPDETRSGANLLNHANRLHLSYRMRGRALRGGRYLHGAFWLGSRKLIEWLGNLQGDDFDGLCMTRVSNINQLYGGREALDIAQRHNARFFNTCMMQTLLGAAVSDALDNNQVVSGVGGQYNFVAMAHAIPNGRSILMLRATRESNGRLVSNILWNYAHTTIPRHLRDLVITEYGIADLRGATDEECVQRMLAICDARFIDSLSSEAKKGGKLAGDFVIPIHWRNNTPHYLNQQLTPWIKDNQFPMWPFACELSAEELQLAKALKRMKAATSTPWNKLRNIARAFLRKNQSNQFSSQLARMQLNTPQSLEEKIQARLLCLALQEKL